MKNLFLQLYKSKNELELETIINSNPIFQNNNNWYPLGGNENNFSTIENQQSSSIGALIEKFTNSIDAILMKKCYEKNINPKSKEAPKTMQEAMDLFYGTKEQWLSSNFTNEQALNIQILADGVTRKKYAHTYDTSLIIYDNGEGQNPKDFESTFLSIGKGNKNDILFVQGKYNMGGTGSIVFCGKHRYQLIASKKYDNSGQFGFTLIRKHPFSDEDKKTKKNTWYEYFKIDDKIPAFDIDSLDLNLYKKQFTTGSIIKLYSYDLPEGARSVISKDLKDRVDEYLFEPALPIMMVDTKIRYPKDTNLQRISFGLKRKLEKGEIDKNKYIDDYFVLNHNSLKTGDTKIISYIFKTKIANKNIKESKNAIKNEFFRSNMYIVFTLNGQVQGHLTSEFITRSLKFPLLKDSLLIHVDCTNMEYDFRSQLFMASRDRLKEGEEYRDLRKLLTEELKNSKLKTIHKERKNSISMDSSDTKNLIKSFTNSLPFNHDLLKLLDNTYDLNQQNEKKKKKKNDNNENTKEKEKFTAKRFPSFFQLTHLKNGINAIKIPKNKSKTIQFNTDAENHYFDRDDEAGELNISIVSASNEKGNKSNDVVQGRSISQAFDISKSSPENGKIKLSLNPTENTNIGDNIKIKVELTSPSNNFEELILVEIIEPSKDKKTKSQNESNETFGLPELILTAEKPIDNKILSWQALNDNGIDMGYNNILFIYSENEEKIEKIYINLDSKVLKDHKSKLTSNEMREKVEKEYIVKVYFHALFLYSINKNNKYKISENNKDGIDIHEYIQNIFQNQYTSFLINFSINDLIDTIDF